MEILKKKIGIFPLGVWFAIIALCLIFLGWIMQIVSLCNWEYAVKLGLQRGSFSGDMVSKTVARKEWGEAVADIIWPLPLAILAFWGIMKNKFIGFISGMMEFAICIYFPLFYTFQLWNKDFETIIAANILWLIPSIFGIMGLWFNKELFLPKESLK